MTAKDMMKQRVRTRRDTKRHTIRASAVTTSSVDNMSCERSRGRVSCPRLSNGTEEGSRPPAPETSVSWIPDLHGDGLFNENWDELGILDFDFPLDDDAFHEAMEGTEHILIENQTPQTVGEIGGTIDMSADEFAETDSPAVASKQGFGNEHDVIDSYEVNKGNKHRDELVNVFRSHAPAPKILVCDDHQEYMTTTGTDLTVAHAGADRVTFTFISNIRETLRGVYVFMMDIDNGNTALVIVPRWKQYMVRFSRNGKWIETQLEHARITGHETVHSFEVSCDEYTALN